MTLKINKSLKEKIAVLEEYFKSNKMDEYLLLSEGQKIAQEEAVYLYNENYFEGDLKIANYFLMSDEDKVERIKDVESFDSFFNYCLRYVDQQEVKQSIFERMANVGYINGENFHSAVEKIHNPDFVGKLAQIVATRDSSYISDKFMRIVDDVPETYRISIYKSVLKDIGVNLKHHLLSQGISALPESKDKDQLILEYICSQNFVEEDELSVVSQEWRAFRSLNNLLYRYTDEERIKLSNYIMGNLDKVNKYIGKEAAMCILPMENIKEHLMDTSNIKMSLVFDFLLFANDSIGKEDKKFVLERYFGDNKIDEIEKWKTIYINFRKEERFEMVDHILGIFGIDVGKEYVFDLFDDVDEQYDLNKYPNIKKALLLKSGITNVDNFEDCINKFGSLIIEYLQSDSIVELIELDSNQYAKILDLFKPENTKLNESVVNTILNSFLQRQFRIEQSDDYNIFARFEELLQEKNRYTIANVAGLLNQIEEIIDVKKFETEKELLIDDLFKHDDKSIQMLHAITNAYIAKKREMYIAKQKNMALDSLKIEKYYNKVYIKKAFLLENSEYSVAFGIKKHNENNLTVDEKEFVDDISRILQVVRFKQNPTQVLKTPELLKDVRIMDQILEKMYANRELKIDKEPEDAKYEYVFESAEGKELLDVLGGLYPKHISEMFEKNEQLYTKLSNFMNKYKFAGWKESFDSLAAACDLKFDKSTIYALINNFDRIENMLNAFPEKNQTLTALIDCASAYGCSSEKYSMLVGKENFEIISLNPGPNQSSVQKDVRVGYIPSLVANMYKRNSVTVPSGEKIVELSNGKNMKFSVGDIYDPIALTYGERTGACLRIKGAFSDLFTYCLADKNGFHIRFENPSTGEFISRVSGIRNGNTVFLNELRDSISEEYNNEDLVETLKQIAKFLVESTKNDPHPIENVIVSNDLAMSKEEKQDLFIADRKEAFNKLKFNITSEGHVLYTANEDHHKLMPYKFGDEYVSEYKPYNNYVQFAGKDKVGEVVNQVNMINELLKGEEFSSILQVEIDGAKGCFYGHGWVVYVDSKNKVHELIIDKFKDDKKLRMLIEESKKKYLGGGHYEQGNR